MLPPQYKAQGNGRRVQTNYKCHEWKTCQLIVSQAYSRLVAHNYMPYVEVSLNTQDQALTWEGEHTNTS